MPSLSKHGNIYCRKNLIKNNHPASFSPLTFYLGYFFAAAGINNRFSLTIACYELIKSIMQQALCKKKVAASHNNSHKNFNAMKWIRHLLAALLLLILFACNNGGNQSASQQKNKTRTDKTAVVQELQLHEMKQEEAARFNPPKIVSDEEVLEQAKIGTINQDGSKDEGLVIPEEEKPFNTEDYDNIVENKFLAPAQNPLSTFSIDVDEAAYSNVRRYLQNGSVPPAGAVRIEELVNYFDYSYPQPVNGDPFAVVTEISECPWNNQHRLVHIGLQGKEIPIENLPNANLVFLIDVSGSMDEPNKLPLVQASMAMLVDQLRNDDKVAIVVYAGNAGLVLPSTRGINKLRIKEAIDDLEAGGSTAGGEGIQLAYKIARENFIKGGNNRIILATDGDFNVGPSSDDDLVRLIEKERQSGVFLSVLGYGMGNYKDNKMQQLADKGNGNHSYIDNINEAKKVLVKEFGSTLFTIAKDVKIQIEFNPSKVQAYRLIGYENRIMAAEDFNDDKKDAGELGSGHTVTALYEVIPVGIKSEFIVLADTLKYQTGKSVVIYTGNEIMTIKLRYKNPDENISKLIIKPVIDEHVILTNTSDNFRFSAAVASFGMLLRNSEYKQNSSYQQIISLAKGAKGKDENGYRQEFIQLAESAGLITKR
jgi:Ca-activated chloride channel homolog